MNLAELGQNIRAQREVAGLSVEEVAGRIKVSARILRTIEEGSTEGLPHAVYTKSFVRAYARIIGYAPEDFTAMLERLYPNENLEEGRPEPGPISRSMPRSTGFFRSLVLLVLLLAVIGGIGFGGWYVFTRYGKDIMNWVQIPFSAVTAPAPADPAPPPRQDARPAARITSQAASPQPAAPPLAPAPAGVGVSLSDSGTTVGTAGGTGAGPLVGSGGGVGGSSPAAVTNNAGTGASAAVSSPAVTEPERRPASGRNVLTINARGECWVGYNADGESGHFTIKPGAARDIEYKSSLELTLGRAGEVSLTHNGKDLGVPGRSGTRAILRFPQDQ